MRIGYAEIPDSDLTPQQLEEEIARLSKRLESMRSTLDAKRRQCQHQWGQPVYDPIIVKGGYDPGDPPGTMGVDRRLPSYYSGSETPRWKRTCSKCGKVEETQRVTEEVKKHPDFGDSTRNRW